MPRYSIDLNDQFDTKLSKMAVEKGTTKAEIIRRAVASYTYLHQQVEGDNGRKISITDGDDRVEKDIVLP